MMLKGLSATLVSSYVICDETSELAAQTVFEGSAVDQPRFAAVARRARARVRRHEDVFVGGVEGSKECPDVLRERGGVLHGRLGARPIQYTELS